MTKRRLTTKKNQITVYSYGKINLSLDVLGMTEDGYHEVEMVMQAILLHDDVRIKWNPGSEKKIKLHTDLPYVPDDERNIAYKAAMLMFERFSTGLADSKKKDSAVSEGKKKAREISGEIEINIKKRIPVAAGLAGGSGNGAAVLMGMAYLWDLELSLEDLMDLGAELGSDVPFSVMSQAACNGLFGYKGDRMAATCALASGRGTHLRPLKPLKSDILLCKPGISVSTAEVYRGIDSCHIEKHPDNTALAETIRKIEEAGGQRTADDTAALKENMINVLENYTLCRYDKVRLIKDSIEKNTDEEAIVLMSGSGPTIFALCDSRQHAKELAEKVRGKGRQTLVTRTLV